MTKKPGVLMILFNEFESDTRVKNEATALAKDHEVFILCRSGVFGRPDRPARETVLVDGHKFPVYRFPFSSRILLQTSFSYAAAYVYLKMITLFFGLYIFMKHGIKILHIHNPPDIYLPVIFLARLTGKKYVFDIHDLVPELHASAFKKGSLSRSWIFLEGLNIKLANAVIVTNESYRKAIKKRHPVQDSRIFTVRNGPKLEMTRHRRTEKEPSDKLRLGFVGNINPQDSVDFLVLAYNELKKKQNDIELLIVGEGKALGKVKAIVKRKNIPDVKFTGFVSDEKKLYRLMDSIDIGVSPDDKNPLNEKSTFIKVLEFMAFGIPVLASDLPENRVSAGDAAVYFKPGSVEDFVEKAEELVKNNSEMKRLGKKGIKRIKNRFSWEYSIPQLLEAYKFKK